MMKIKILYVRFYKSFNFDYLRKVHPDASFAAWDLIDQVPYPYVRIDINSSVTTVVGANESGKSHLLTAIEKGLTGENIRREDFCRYSRFFTVEEGKTRWPEFGFEFVDLDEADKKAVGDACGLPGAGIDRFLLFRTEIERLTVYLPSREKYSAHQVKSEKAAGLRECLPRVVHLRADVALPDSVPIHFLVGADKDFKGAGRYAAAITSRRRRFQVFDTFEAVIGQPGYFESSSSVQTNAAKIKDVMSPLLEATNITSSGGAPDDAGVSLTRDLLFRVARVDKSAVQDLYRALREGNDGHANGLVQKINDHLAATLNFPHWWVQDRDFRLVVTPRDFDLVLTIRDRTGTEYSFSERSGGLKYFLSYYVQYRAHAPSNKRSEILLMDEPDAHLSSEGQQDLLKIFEAFANPTDGRAPVQVVYVTHSPFLIDKNHAERIRVLEKGVSEEGTRVVRDAARNHYEPLRSAFGSYLGESTFMGNCNLIVEGTADQVLLAGAATQLRSRNSAESNTLDLNQLTIVPAGSASHIPYLVFLARGRDVERPTVIVLLDSDNAGADAAKTLKKGGPRRRLLLRENLILQVGSLEGVQPSVHEVFEIEDLVPLEIALRACRSYAKDLCGIEGDGLEILSEAEVRKCSDGNNGVFRSLAAIFTKLGLHLDKVAFARYVLQEASLCGPASSTAPDGDAILLKAFDTNFGILFAKLNSMRRDAERESRADRISQRIERVKRSFLLDHPNIISRGDALIFMEDVEAVLDDTQESDCARAEIQRIRRDFRLETDSKLPISERGAFETCLERLRYAGRMAVQDSPGPDSSRVAGEIDAQEGKIIESTG